jgi:plastocyanin domain-containing protein
MNKGKSLAAIALVALAFAAQISAGAQTGTKKPTQQVPKPAVQKATVTINGGYSPATLSVTAGRPVEITFVRKSAAGCDGELVIPALKVNKTLKQGEKTVVRFTPKKGQTIAFACGMNMYEGQVVAK